MGTWFISTPEFGSPARAGISNPCPFSIRYCAYRVSEPIFLIWLVGSRESDTELENKMALGFKAIVSYFFAASALLAQENQYVLVARPLDLNLGTASATG